MSAGIAAIGCAAPIAGNAATFTCAYHGWTYRNDGRLVGVPYLKEAYHGELDRERWGLTPVAQLDSYKGLLFATFDPRGAAIARVSRRDGLVPRHVLRPPRGRHRDGRRPINGSCRATGSFRPRISAATPITCIGPICSAIADRVQRRVDGEPTHRQRMVSPGNGHVLICIGPDGCRRRADARDPGLRARDPPRGQYSGSGRAPPWSTRSSARCSRISRCCAAPRAHSACGIRAGPDKTEIWSWVFADKAAPPEVKNAFRLAGVRGFSPAGTFEQDDMDNWQECTQTCRGVMSRRMPINNQMGLGHERFDAALGAWASDLRLQREQPSAILPALGRADGRRELGRGLGGAHA